MPAGYGWSPLRLNCPVVSTLVRQLTAAGVHAAVGHSDAGYAVAAKAFAAGADLVTHAFNGMRPLHHRDPAIIGAAMDAPEVLLEVINDGVHVHEAVVRLLRGIAPGRLVLITDAMGAAAASDGMYRLAGYDVRVQDGVARMVTGTRRRWVPPADPSRGRRSPWTLPCAGRCSTSGCAAGRGERASLLPARFLGMDHRYGSVAPGRVADLVVTGADSTCAR